MSFLEDLDPYWYWHLAVATKAGGMHPTGMLCCAKQILLRSASWFFFFSVNRNK